PNQLVGAPLGTDVTIECQIEASPKSINYWVKDTARMSLTVRLFQKEDVGSYRCIAKNSLGEVDSSIRLYEIPGRSRKIHSPKFNQNNAYKDINKLSVPLDDEEQLYDSNEGLEDTSDPSITYNKQNNLQDRLQSSKLFGTSRTPLEHPNSVNGFGFNGGLKEKKNPSNKQLPSMDIITRKPFFVLEQMDLMELMDLHMDIQWQQQ
uniref:Ig-like domain-containing protein n=1 Tax=Anopheles epiroticus TaxID=199890 RepID=A0A182PWW7_9DIPT